MFASHSAQAALHRRKLRFLVGFLSAGALFMGGPLVHAEGVTIAGRVDGALQSLNDGQTTTTKLVSGTYYASRLIIRGDEDLGGGLKTVFNLESRFDITTGAQQNASKLFNAQDFVGLSSTQYGTLTAGRQYVPIFWSMLWADDTGPARLHGYSALQTVQRSNLVRVASGATPVRSAGSLDSIGSGIYSIGITSSFEDSLLVYKSPDLAGSTFMLAVGGPEGSPVGGGKITGANWEYRAGGFFGSIAANSKRGTVPAGGGSSQEVTEQVASAMYAVTSDVKLWGNFHPWQFTSSEATIKGQDWMLGASYLMPSGQLWLNYAAKTIDNCTACGSRGFGIGYHYFLSKRTELYGSYATITNDSNAGNTLNGTAPAALGQNISGVAFGLAMQF